MMTTDKDHPARPQPLTAALVDIAISVLHHDGATDEKAVIYEREVLRRKFDAALQAAQPPTAQGVDTDALAEAQATIDAYDDAMKSQSGNMADAKLIVMANYGDLCAGHLRAILKSLKGQSHA